MTHHPLWEGGRPSFEAATDEEVVKALFNGPPFQDPEIFGYLKRHRGAAIATYQQMFYNGETPGAIATIRQRATGL